MKKFITKGLLGILICEFILLILSLAFSYLFLKGDFSLANPALLKNSSSVFNASFTSVYLSALLGIVFGFASVVWEEEKFSLLKRTIIHFLLTSSSISFVGYKLFWFGRSSASFAFFFIIYILIYLVIWAIQYFIYKKEVEKLNAKIK